MSLINAQVQSSSGSRDDSTRMPDGVPADARQPPVIDHGARYSIIQKVHALALMAEDFAIKYVEAKTGIPQRSLHRIKKTAFDRGFRPDEDPRILEAYVIDGKRSGRPKKGSESVETKLLANVYQDSNSGEKTSKVLTYKAGIQRISALRNLHEHGLAPAKATRGILAITDLNVIEPAWFWINRRNISHGATRNIDETEKR